MTTRATFATPRNPMRNHLKLTGHIVSHVPGGISTGSFDVAFDLAECTVQIPLPLTLLENDLAVSPFVTQDGDNALRIDLERWWPIVLRTPATRFPFWLPGHALAVRVCRDFDTDRTTSWQDGPDQIKAWLRRWGAQHDVTF
jgi:hypothetical protein